MIEAIRAPLFVPANRPDRFEKAAASGADAVILDLEDAVAADDKADARASLRCDFTDLPVLVRVNAMGTSWHEADLEAVTALPFAAVVLPKAEDPERLDSLGIQLPVLALIESAKGLAEARKIAALENVVRLAFGSIDFCADLGCAHTRSVLLPARYELVLASRLSNIAAPIDGVTAKYNDPEQTRLDASHAREMGMSGKLCIHPKQVADVFKAFAPTAEEVEWAQRVLGAGDGAVSVDGEMVDEPVRIRARAILGAAR